MVSPHGRLVTAATLGLAAAVLVGFAACKGDETRAAPQPAGNAGGGGEGGGDLLPQEDGGPPPLDAQGFCGNQLHQTIRDAPNVYFVIDASGSMDEAVSSSGGNTRFDVVHKATVALVSDLGALINVGAALFPKGATNDEPCLPGAQVMAVSPGDPYTGSEGPTTAAFRKKTNVSPSGGTPTSATLEKLTPGLKALPGKTLVLLVTDGGPNCNADATCAASECQPNIEGCSGSACCNPGGNCCAADQPGGPESCIDRPATVAAVKALAEAGVPVYVIGIPGSEAYAGVLEEMAIAAGTAQVAKPFYFAVDDVDNLRNVLGSIAAVAVSCIFTVEDPPKEPDQTNVYLDGTVLPADLDNGWRWMDPDLLRIELLGDACQALKTGKVKSVQIVSGCPTEPPL